MERLEVASNRGSLVGLWYCAENLNQLHSKVDIHIVHFFDMHFQNELCSKAPSTIINYAFEF